MRVLAVKGSGGDLGSIGKAGFALLYLDKLENLISRYKGEAHEDEMVGYYPLAAFGESRVAASIDTPLHGFLPFPVPTSTISIRIGPSRSLPAPTERPSWRSSINDSVGSWSGFHGNGPASNLG